MRKIHILTTGFASPNSVAFLFPFIVFRRELRQVDINIQIFTDADNDGLSDCDFLFIESRFYSHRWETEGDQRVLLEISNLSSRVAIIWFDISDSTGWLQPQVLPFVHSYCKAQLYRDLTLYMRPHYGNRIWTDYYYQSAGVQDQNPAKPRVVTERSLLKKLRVSWNSGIADYRLFGPQIMGLRQFLPFDFLFQLPRHFTPTTKTRAIPWSCRMGLTYARNSVSYQRQQIKNILGSKLDTKKLSRRAYYAEMKKTRLVVSPFGFGEITLKDFEAILCGAALLKPDMSHMVTWPDIYRVDETIISHAWDLSDFEEKCTEALECPENLVRIAAAAQDEYRAVLDRREARTAFCRHLLSILAHSP